MKSDGLFVQSKTKAIGSLGVVDVSLVSSADCGLL